MKTTAGRFGPPTLLGQEQILAAIRACICPWCGRGPWKMLAGHVGKAHGVGRKEFRDMAGLKVDDSICDPQYSALRSEFTRSQNLKPPRSLPGRKHVYVGAGRAVQREKAAARGAQARRDREPCAICGKQIPFRPGNADKRTCGEACLSEARSREMIRRRAASTIPAEKIRERYAGGGVTQRQLATDFNVSLVSVSRAIRRAERLPPRLASRHNGPE